MIVFKFDVPLPHFMTKKKLVFIFLVFLQFFAHANKIDVDSLNFESRQLLQRFVHFETTLLETEKKVKSITNALQLVDKEERTYSEVHLHIIEIAKSFFLKKTEFKTLATNYIEELTQGQQFAEAAFVYYNIGNIMYKFDDVGQATDYFLLADKLFEKVNLTAVHPDYQSVYVSLANTLGFHYYKQKKYNQSEDFYLKALERAKLLQIQVWEGIVEGNLGVVYLENQGNDTLFLSKIKKDIAFSKQHQECGSIITAYQTLIEYCVKTHQYQRALVFADSCKFYIHNCKPEFEQSNESKLKRLHVLYALKNDVFKHFNSDSANAQNLDSLSSITMQMYELIQNKYNQEKRVKYLKENAIKEAAELKNQNKFNSIITLFLIIIITVLTITVILFYRITQKLKTNKQFIEEQKKQLEILNDEKNKLFSILSHDLKAPFNNLKQLIVFYKDKLISAEEFSQHLHEFDEDLEAVTQTVDGLLQWSAMSLKSGLTTNASTFYLTDVLTEVMDQVKNMAKAKGIQVEENLEKSTPVVFDKDHFTIVLRNLISNAIKFTPKNGRVKISSEMMSKKIKISISDNGVGMSNQQLESIFENNKISSQQGTEGEKGTGVGLMLTKELVELNHAEIQIESKEHQGTTVTLILPAGNKS